MQKNYKSNELLNYESSYLNIKSLNKKNAEISVQGSKNAVLPVMISSLLTDNTITINNVPKIYDVKVLCEIFKNMGSIVQIQKDTLKIKNNITKDTIKVDKIASEIRASILLAAPLLKKSKKVIMPFPGGDQLGHRPIDIHIDLLEKFGASVKVENNNLVISRGQNLNSIQYTFSQKSVGASQQAIMCASFAKGTTLLENYSQEPETINLINALLSMGVKIEGLGTNKLRITGISYFKSCNIDIIPDRLEAGTLIVLNCILKSKLKLNNILIEHHSLLFSELLKNGVTITNLNPNSIIVDARQAKFDKGIRLSTMPYPGFPTDLQPIMCCLALICNAKSVIIENIYLERFEHINKLKKMGANIYKESNQLTLFKSSLINMNLQGDDIRDFVTILCASFINFTPTRIYGVKHMYRGHEDLLNKLKKMGIDSEVCYE
ncbi:UDP-N-acetylglucosamine 1-carboxyvinyltransferase [Mammaliicoccus sciuri]|uniref:UDP-N-acetylglucosamine 1-carboxyvinyltransferase n=1 Tax=Mammaliicoccus sciuri TaxID=1296 RepID=UPI003F54E028